MFRFLPEQASDFAHKVDWINNLITDISVFFTIAIVGSMVIFAIVWRKKGSKDHETPGITGSHLLEAVWTIVPTIICIFVAGYGYAIYDEMRDMPPDAPTINVTARQWNWDFEYPNGKKTTDQFVIPVDKPVRLLMTSNDVLHSFFVPAMRVKNDVIPKQYTSLWFRPIKTGEFRVFCTEYCGKDHSAMLANLRVVSQDEYDRWLEDNSQAIKESRMTPEQRGAETYGRVCVSCHSLDGSIKFGPSFLRIYGKQERLADGSTVEVDENYLRESIINPGAKIVEGFANQMPSQAGQLSDEEITHLIAFIKSVKEPVVVEPEPVDTTALANMSPAERGEVIYKSKTCVACHSLDGSKVIGPTFKGIYGRKGKLADGSEYVADDAYITHSIKDPAAQIVEGFPPQMPPMPLSDDEIKDVIEFMKTVK